jgi:hypothetical protein
MEKINNQITRKKALKFVAWGSASSLLMPALFAIPCTTKGRPRTGGYLNYNQIFNTTYPFSLAPLPYAAEALEPVIDARTMEIHHSRHHQGYINNLNYQNRRADYIEAWWDLIYWEKIEEIYENL